MVSFQSSIIQWSFIALLSILWLSSCKTQKELKQAREYQIELIADYANRETSPLQGAELDTFQGLTFFPVDKKYIIEARFSPISKGKLVQFNTSSGQIREYKEYGSLDFKIDKMAQKLIVYQSYPINENYPEHLFLPFYDLTNGVETYGGGRYLDLEISDIKHKKVTLNFNKTYNPYCAYSTKYSCPIPPIENTLTVAIMAGVAYVLEY